MSSYDKARYIVEHVEIMTIATADAEGTPWASPVGFVYDDALNLFWVSYKNSQHSKNIARRSDISVSIWGKAEEHGLDGVYMKATATELSNPHDIQAAIDLFAARRPQPPQYAVQSIDEVSGPAAWRLYKAVPTEISKRSATTINNQAITIREIINLP